MQYLDPACGTVQAIHRNCTIAAASVQPIADRSLFHWPSNFLLMNPVARRTRTPEYPYISRSKRTQYCGFFVRLET